MSLDTDLLEIWLEDLVQQHIRAGDVQTIRVGARAPSRNWNRAMSDSSVTGRRRQPPRSAKTHEDVPTGHLLRLHLSQSAPIPSLPPPPVVADKPSSSPDWELQSTTSAATSATRPTSYSAAGGSQKGSRSRSPVKSPLDLRFTTKPLRYEPALPAVSATSVLSDADMSLLRDLKRIATGQGTIPRSMQHEVEAVVGVLDEVASWMLRGGDEDVTDLPRLRREFDDVKDLVAHSIECDVMEMSEAAWNTDVHMPLLHLALRGSPAVGAYNITTARPCRDLLPKSVAVEESEARLVDLSINVRPEVEPAVAEHIRRLLATEPVALRTINQSLYKLLCWRPSAVCIETKGAASGGADELEARSQLLQWTSAWLTRMRRFLHARAVDQIEADAAMAKLGFPVIIVSCQAWHLYLIKDTSAAVIMYNVLELGDTHSVLGIYKLLSCLRRLAEWAKGPFWSWFKQDILAF